MPKTLLLADDSITIQKVVGITLANEDLQIVSVDNGEDAIAKAKAMRPDMVLADASMPKKDGYQVAEALKGDPATAMIPVLILAGQLEGHPDQARLAACKADGFLPKPFESSALIDRVRKTLGLAGPAPRATPAAATAAAAKPAPGAPLTTPRPATPTPAAVTQPAPVARPAPTPPPVAPPAPLAAAPAIDETDFGDLSAQPAASGDPELWGSASPVGIAADDNLWTSGENSMEPTPNPNGNAAASPFEHPEPHGAPPELVTNPAELANIGNFEGDGIPSGLDLDETVPKTAPTRAGDDNLKHASEMMGTENTTGSNALPADLAAQITPEKLEAMVREIVKQMIGPILEKIAWEVVPDLAEDIIRDELKRLTNGAVSGSSKTGTA